MSFPYFHYTRVMELCNRPLEPIAKPELIGYVHVHHIDPMTTELLFRDDAYLKTAVARVVAATERGIELDRTIFYPQGGGQVGDTGVLLRENGERVLIGDTR